MQVAIDHQAAQAVRQAETHEGVRRGLIMTIAAMLTVLATYTITDIQVWYLQLLSWLLVGLGGVRTVQGVRDARSAL